jgi:hypothetical protein
MKAWPRGTSSRDQARTICTLGIGSWLDETKERAGRSPIKMQHIRALGGGSDAVTIRITTVSLREPRVGDSWWFHGMNHQLVSDKFASRHGHPGVSGIAGHHLISKGDSWISFGSGRPSIHPGRPCARHSVRTGRGCLRTTFCYELTWAPIPHDHGADLGPRRG